MQLCYRKYCTVLKTITIIGTCMSCEGRPWLNRLTKLVVVQLLPMSTRWTPMLSRFNPDLWQYASMVPCHYGLKVVYEISPPLT